MSSAHDAHGAAAAHAHDDHAFDGEPAHELSPGEPRSPAWLPALGAAFFSLVAVYMLTGGESSASTPPPPKPEAAQAAAPAPQPQQPAAPAREVRREAIPLPPAGSAAPGGSAAAVRKLTAEQVQELQKRIRDNAGKGAPAGKPVPRK